MIADSLIAMIMTIETNPASHKFMKKHSHAAEHQTDDEEEAEEEVLKKEKMHLTLEFLKVLMYACIKEMGMCG